MHQFADFNRFLRKKACFPPQKTRILTFFSYLSVNNDFFCKLSAEKLRKSLSELLGGVVGKFYVLGNIRNILHL